MPIKNYKTVVPAKRSVSEIQEILSDHGAISISVRNENRVPTEVSFTLPTRDGEQEFVVRADIAGVRRSLVRAWDARRVPEWWTTDPDKPVDIAWRITRDWIDATCAIIEAGLAEPRQAFLAYAVAVTGRSVYEEIMSRQQLLALPEGRREA